MDGELGNKVNADLCATLFNFFRKYGFEIGCNADSRISFETEKSRIFFLTRFFCQAESASAAKEANLNVYTNFDYLLHIN